MGLFNRKKKNTEPEEHSVYEWMTLGEAYRYSKGIREASDNDLTIIVDDACKQLNSLRKMQEKTKTEYAAVTAYLSDIQRIEQIPEKDRENINSIVEGMIALDEERMRHRERRSGITSAQMKRLETYEGRISSDLKDMYEHEKYMNLVQTDLRSVEGEKAGITAEKEAAVSKREFLKKFSMFFLMVMFAVFILLIMLAMNTGKDFAVPFFISGCAAIGYSAYLLVAMKNANDEIKRSDVLLNRAVVLTNKINIKFVNTKNALDYSYEKYGVESASELEQLTVAYKREKEAEVQFKKNTQLLNLKQNALTEQLARWQLESTDIWIHQPEALIDAGEMLELRHSLNSRRQKLRAQLDYNMKQQDSVLNELESLKNKHNTKVEFIEALMADNGIKA